jgi:enoyl-CoA hydratase/carnithine racemase
LHLLTGDIFDSAEALRLNFVQKVVPPTQLMNEAMHIAQQIANQAPMAVTATRLNVLKGAEHGPLVAMDDFLSVQQQLARSDDAAEGLRAFVERRPAKFTGT